MSSHYITSADHLPEESGAETTLQITDAQTKRIFEARVRIAQDPDELADPVPLTVVAGPHESVSETMYVELLDETDASGLDRELLTRLATDQEAASNVLNTRSDDLSVLLRYLVETGEYESTADALREVAFDGLAAERSALLDAYAEVREELHDDPLGRAIAERE
ncbi:MAG: ubiD operon protein [Halorientalis sp.]